jgi:hypothetical protein
MSLTAFNTTNKICKVMLSSDDTSTLSPTANVSQNFELWVEILLKDLWISFELWKTREMDA